MRKAFHLLLALSLALAPVLSASAQGVNSPHTLARSSKLFTSTGTWTVPADVTDAWVDGVAPGGTGGGGQASANTAGGGGGGGGMAAVQCHIQVTPGASITVTVPAAPTSVGAGVIGTAGSNVTLAGQTYPLTFFLQGGAGGAQGAATVGGIGGGSAFQSAPFGGGQGGSTSGNNASFVNNSSIQATSFLGPCFYDSAPGGGGGPTAGVAGNGGLWPGVSVLAAKGTGNGAGGGGGASFYGSASAGTAAGVACVTTPGNGGGGGGGGTNAASCPGGPGFVRFFYYTASGQ